MREVITSSSFFIGKKAEGLISFGSGQPDLRPPQAVYDSVHLHNEFRYSPVKGQNQLCEALAKNYPNAIPDQFVITNGASEALDLVLRIIGLKGGKFILPRPYYYSYPYNVKFAGLDVGYYDLIDGKIDIDNFEKSIEGAVGVLINSPANPTGSIQEIEVLREIESMTRQKGIYVISDEVYKDLIYERENYLIQGPRVITINSFSKTYGMCGYRIGYLYSTDLSLVQDVVEMKCHTSMNTNNLAQEMAFAATQVPREVTLSQIDIWKERRDTIYNGMRTLGLDLWKPEGAFYVLPAIKDSNAAVNELYYNHKIITYDGGWFGAPDRVRFSYALDKEKIEEGLNRLEDFLKGWRKR